MHISKHMYIYIYILYNTKNHVVYKYNPRVLRMAAVRHCRDRNNEDVILRCNARMHVQCTLNRSWAFNSSHPCVI